MKTDEKRLIRQGEIPIGYWEGETVFLDSEFLGCGIGRELIRRGRSVRWVPGIARELDPALTIHDFRITAGPIHTNILFDVVVPYDLKLTDAQVKAALTQGLKEMSDRYFPVIQVDHSYVEEQKP